jgi:hypothetical protein
MTRQEYIEMWQRNAVNDYFYDHEARRSIYDKEISVIDWRNKYGSYINHVRYFFDRNALYITGDLGEAIFQCSGNEFASRWIREECDINYFLGKMRCSRGAKYEINKDVWDHDFEEWLNEESLNLTSAERIADNFEMYGEGGYEQSIMWDDELGSLYDIDTLEDISRFGAVPQSRVILWLEGLKMAREQLKK